MCADADVNPAHPGGKQPEPDQPTGTEQLFRALIQGDQEDKKYRYRPQCPDVEWGEGQGLQGTGDQKDRRCQPGIGGKLQVKRMAQAVLMTHFGLPATNG